MKPPDRLRRPPDYLLSVLREGALPFSYRSRVRVLLAAPVAVTGVASSAEATGLHFEYAASSRRHEAHSPGAAEDDKARPVQPESARLGSAARSTADVQPAPAIFKQEPPSVTLPSASPAGLSPHGRAGDAGSIATAPAVPPPPRPASEPALAGPDTPPIEVSRRRRETATVEAATAETVISPAQREAGTSPPAVPDERRPTAAAPVVLRIPSSPEASAPSGPAPPTLQRRADPAAAVEPLPHRTVSGSRRSEARGRGLDTGGAADASVPDGGCSEGPSGVGAGHAADSHLDSGSGVA